jgi:protocatechuate 3,4-dioxygenase, alpha subunit
MRMVPTGSQTVGPFFSIGLSHLCSAQTVLKGRPVEIRGRVIDANGDGVPDAVLEIWQADPLGHYAEVSDDSSGLPAGFARVASDDSGGFRFSTCRPGPVSFDRHRKQAPHLVVLVFARGLLRHLITRMYFPDEPDNLTDPVLESVPEDRRGTLVARRVSVLGNKLEWQVVLRGEKETVFFAW